MDIKKLEKKVENYRKSNIVGTLGAILLGDLILAIAIHWFYSATGLVSAGVTGISLLINYMTGLSTGISIFLLNIPIVLLGYRYLSKTFTNFALASAVVLSMYLYVLEQFKVPFKLDDTLLAAIIGGSIMGVGLGILFRNGTCSGGTDILGMILKKQKDINIGTGLMILNVSILLIAISISGVQRVLYSMVAMFLSYRILDKIELGIGETKQVYIITEKIDEVSEIIIKKLNAGLTLIHGEGAYQHQEKDILMTVMKRRQVSQLKQILKVVDENAFMIITDATEVNGKGFRRLNS